MRIDELRDKLFDLGDKYCLDFKIEEYSTGGIPTFIDVDINYSGQQFTVAALIKEKQYSLTIISDVMGDLPGDLQEELFEILVKFARTPAGEREEEKKKYQYRLKEKYCWISNRGSISNNFLNLNYGESTPYIILNDKGQVIGYKTIFTDKEIEELAEKYDIDLEMFDKIEVEDE